MNWKDLKKLSCWSPLKKLPFESFELGDTLFKIDEQAFLIAVPYNQKYERTKDAPFVTIIMWAQSDGAAKRAISLEIENDVINDNLPPNEMLIAAGINNYKKIKDELKTGRYGENFESAIYRIATDGAFVHRKVESDLYEFYFRNLEGQDDELPYAIVYRLT